MASHTITINKKFGGKVIKNVLKNVTAVLSLDPGQVDSPRLKLAIWMIRLGMWVGGLGRAEFEFEGEYNESGSD